MAGLNTLLSIGQSALGASQSAIQVTGNNIANVNTVGYSRQQVVLRDGLYLDSSPGQLGTGVVAQEVVRSHDAFVEAQYLGKASARDCWKAIYNNMQGVETLFNESNSSGINSALSTFFDDWGTLETNPDSEAARETAISDTQSLLALLRQTDASLQKLQAQADTSIANDVDSINSLAAQIASINKQINETQIDGVNIPNGLYDTRDSLVRQLSAITDVNVVDKGKGDLTIYTQAGQTIVDGTQTFQFKFESGKTTQQLTSASTFQGQAYYSGTDSKEYTLKVTSDPNYMNVSLDGGKTWLTDANGSVIKYPVSTDQNGKVHVGNLDIWFGSATDSNAPPTGSLAAGDTFTLVPQKSVYWYETTSSAVNVTPQQYANGQMNSARLTGGDLAGQCEFRDQYVGGYRERLRSMIESLIWEVNRIHSQGAGTKPFSSTLGTYSVQDDTIALGSAASGLAFGSRLASGASMLHVYDSGGNLVAGKAIDFSSIHAGNAAFDPATDSLQDVADAINATFAGQLSATIVNHQLKIDGVGGNTFRYGQDSSGLYAALGCNTLLTGSTPYTAGVNAVVASNPDNLCIGHVNGAGEVNAGDITTAKAMVALESKNVTFTSTLGGPTSQTLSQYYSGLVGVVGVDTQNAQYQYQYQSALASQLDEQQLEISGVNLDEELSNLIKFQHSYQAAAKLISTADQLFQTVLGLKN